MREGRDGEARAGAKERPRIYQLMVRHFGNTNETREPDGMLARNGCGKFADIDETALASLREMGFTQVWLTGVLEQASATAYPGRPADDPAIVKGKAGSPYAIRDYFDVSPDYAVEPERRLSEFRQLLTRCEGAGLKVLLDFVPNHVARSYHSDVQPELSFGAGDRRGVFFERDNNFYYLGAGEAGGGPPLRLPGRSEGDEAVVFAPEREFGRVTGNNVRSWSPSRHDWYETVKLNYGHDYTTGRDTSHLPDAGAALDAVPDTWRKMDAVLKYWLEFGVSGFRVDMAHMIPMEFWRWVIARIRSGPRPAFFMAEAYDGDPAKLTDRNVEEALLESGFDAVYDSTAYQLVQGIYEGPKWANDLDQIGLGGARSGGAVRYAENHDEVRIANPQRWGGHGMAVGKPVTAILFGSGSGPVMIYNGQEVGEPAIGESGFSGDDGRTTLFDYWSLPELVKWVNGHRYDGAVLSAGQRDLRHWYGKLLHCCGERAFVEGEFVPLNPANVANRDYGRLAGEAASGHWLYSFLRIVPAGGQAFLVVANLHWEARFAAARVRLPPEVVRRLPGAEGSLRMIDRLDSDWEVAIDAERLVSEGLALPELAPCSALFLEIRR